MGDSNSIKDRRLKVANSQKRRRMPDVILHTKNVMNPTVKPVPFKQSCGTPFSKNRHQIMKAQNYRKNPALLFSDAPLRTLYNSWKNPLEVKQVGRCKGKNQSTKHTVLGKTESRSMKKTSISQNSYPSKRSSRKKRNNASHFPNTVLAQSEPSTYNKDLHKASSRSIKLSRKGDLQTQIKESQIKHEDIFSFLPKIETPINNVTNKPVVALPCQSFYDIADTVSTVSTVSLSSYKISNYKIENKKTFGDIANRAKSISNRLHPSNSEYEINVLHYENDILPGNDCPQFAQSHLKSTSTNWSAYDCSAAKIQDDNLANERNTIESHTWDEGKIMDDIKWKLDNWVPPSQRKELDNECEIKIAEKTENRSCSPYRCKIKYSWQVIGTGTQTSHTLLQDLLNNIELNNKKSAYKMCSIKYSWQIIGISTQASLHDHNDPDYWRGMLLTPSKNYNGSEETGNNETDAKLHDYTKYPERRLKKYLILNNQQTQTFAEKEIQADPNDCYAKYSWHNLIKQYL